MDNLDLTHHFLIAMPNMADPFFNRSLIYLCEHNPQGAMGIIVNRPIDLALTGFFEKVELELDSKDIGRLPVHFGGPVQTDRGFVLHRPNGKWQSSLKITDEIGLTSSKDILVTIGKTGKPQDIIVTLGYAGWGAGQLENELGQNAWLTVSASADILFKLPPEDRLPAAMQTLGISFAQLSGTAGHA
ncbi:MAG: YqgE/AlgH family protein [Zoogloeaceae bacterium]|jgi:putative transcriptional regulator|nr:YqgE/AlgH family protein [Zoogloeaceae bacterium]